ncbi:MAG: hypothetical protein JWM20_575 [Patescibacteria group bacterium]|nr:hypothetical protein [Patescibacteria group bacterium]
MKKFLASLSTFALIPALASAQIIGTSGTTGLGSLVVQFKGLLSALFPIAIAIGVLAFFYELIMFIVHKSDDKAEKFKKGILMSLLALFLMFTFFGLLNVIANTLGLSGAVGQGVQSNQIPAVQL